MRFMMNLKADKRSDTGIPPDDKLLGNINTFKNATMARVLLAGEAPHPSAKRACVKFSGQKRHLIDGPFAETKELSAASAFRGDRHRDAADLRDRGFRFERHHWRSQEERGEVGQRRRAVSRA